MIATANAKMVNSKISSSGGFPEPLFYERSTRGYAATPRIPVDFTIPQNAFKHPLRSHPISFGETLQGRPSEDKRVKTVNIPESSFKTVNKINVDYDPPPIVNKLGNSAVQMMSDANRYTRIDTLDQEPLVCHHTGKIKVVTMTTPNLIPKSDLSEFISFAVPQKRQSRDPDASIPEIKPRTCVAIKPNPRINLDIIGDSFDRSIIPFAMPTPAVVSHVSQLNWSKPPKRPDSEMPLTEPVSFAFEGRQSRPDKPPDITTDPYVPFKQPIIPFGSSMALSRNFSTSKPIPIDKPTMVSPINPVDKIQFAYATEPTRPVLPATVGDPSIRKRPTVSFAPPLWEDTPKDKPEMGLPEVSGGDKIKYNYATEPTRPILPPTVGDPFVRKRPTFSFAPPLWEDTPKDKPEMSLPKVSGGDKIKYNYATEPTRPILPPTVGDPFVRKRPTVSFAPPLWKDAQEIKPEIRLPEVSGGDKIKYNYATEPIRPVLNPTVIDPVVRKRPTFSFVPPLWTDAQEIKPEIRLPEVSGGDKIRYNYVTEPIRPVLNPTVIDPAVRKMPTVSFAPPLWTDAQEIKPEIRLPEASGGDKIRYNYSTEPIRPVLNPSVGDPAVRKMPTVSFAPPLWTDAQEIKPEIRLPEASGGDKIRYNYSTEPIRPVLNPSVGDPTVRKRPTLSFAPPLWTDAQESKPEIKPPVIPVNKIHVKFASAPEMTVSPDIPEVSLRHQPSVKFAPPAWSDSYERKAPPTPVNPVDKIQVKFISTPGVTFLPEGQEISLRPRPSMSFAPPAWSSISELPKPPVPNFSLSTLKPDKFYIK